MVYRIIEELRSSDPSIILNSLEEADDFLILEGVPREEIISLLDAHGDPIWSLNREDLVNTINNVVLDWDQDNQVLTRTLDFRDEQLFNDFREMLSTMYNLPQRSIDAVFTGTV